MKIRIAQCWDDGVATDLQLTGILRKYNAKATFNLCPGKIPETTVYPHREPFCTEGRAGWDLDFKPGSVGLDKLRETYAGFETATHCWQHENAQLVSPEVFADSAIRTRKFLEETFQRECAGFAWPYGRTTPETVKLLKEAGFAYGRTTTYTDNVNAIEEPRLLASSCHFMDVDFWTKLQSAKAAGHDFYFWGHSYELRDHAQKWLYFDNMIHALSCDPELEWCNVIDLVR